MQSIIKFYSAGLRLKEKEKFDGPKSIFFFARRQLSILLLFATLFAVAQMAEAEEKRSFWQKVKGFFGMEEPPLPELDPEEDSVGKRQQQARGEGGSPDYYPMYPWGYMGGDYGGNAVDDSADDKRNKELKK